MRYTKIPGQRLIVFENLSDEGTLSDAMLFGDCIIIEASKRRE